MSIAAVRDYLTPFGLADKILEFSTSSATVELAAQAAGVIPARIAKTLSFLTPDGPVLILAAGDAKIDNSKYKARFHTKAKMIGHDEVEPLIGHGVGGVCPFGINEGVPVWLDESLRRFDIVYPAAGTANSAVKLHLDELERASQAQGWVDVCKGWQEEEP